MPAPPGSPSAAGLALMALADHHAITGASLADSWALVPSWFYLDDYNLLYDAKQERFGLDCWPPGHCKDGSAKGVNPGSSPAP